MFTFLKSLQNNSEVDDKIFLTFDMDWAHDLVIRDTLGILEKFNATATWFVTHDSKILNDLRKHSLNFELGIHPNFNPLFFQDSDKKYSSAKDIILNILKVVPEAVSARSHSLTTNSIILNELKLSGILLDANIFLPWRSGICIYPYFADGVLRCPHFFADDDYILSTSPLKKPKASDLLSCKGLKIFDFHPIHIFLNTENIERYEGTRHLHNDPEKLIEYRYDGYGVRNLLIDILNASSLNYQ